MNFTPNHLLIYAATDDTHGQVKIEANDVSEDEPLPAAAAAPGPAHAAKQRQQASRKRGRSSNVDAAAKALIGLTGLPTPVPAAAAAGRQRIAAALPAVGYRPFAGIPLSVSSRHGAAAGQQCDAPYDYYDVYQSYLACMDMYSKAVGSCISSPCTHAEQPQAADAAAELMVWLSGWHYMTCKQESIRDTRYHKWW